MTVFADTWYLVALTNPQDTWHNEVKKLVLKDQKVITTEAVLTEYLNTFSGHGAKIRKNAVNTVREIRGLHNFSIIEQSHSYFEKSLKLFEKRLDKDYSLTDCFSMVVMKEERINTIITMDAGFRKEGFDTLPGRKN